MLSVRGALIVAVGAGLAFSGIWIALAAIRPGVTFHLAPLIAAASVSVTYRIGSGRVGRPLEVAASAAVGAALASGTLAILDSAGLLDGPAFDPFGDVVAESLVGIAIGVIAGLVVQLWPSRAATGTG